MTLNVVAVDDHIAEVNPDAISDALFGRLRGFCGFDLLLSLQRESNGLDDARKLDEGAVTHQLNDPPAMQFDGGKDDVSPVVLQAPDRAFFIVFDEPAVPDNVGGNDRR